MENPSLRMKGEGGRRNTEKSTVRWSKLPLLLLCLLLPSSLRLHASEGDRIFTLKVLPLFKEKCFGCHGDDPEEIRGGFDMRSRAGMLRGGESEEAAIIPGRPEDSPLYQAIQWDGLEMPPKENDRLTKVQVDYVRRWIADGAPWPDAAAQLAIQKQEWSVTENEEGVIVPTSGGLADSWTYRRYKPEDIWAFQPLRTGVYGWAQGEGVHPVDYFVNATLQDAGMAPAGRADPRALIRRATYDLIGLPPTPAEISAFEEESRRDPQSAFSELIDRLLDSPHYGERWGQHWLDVARYADTGGYSNDYERSNMWRYRDYVIRAFNNDKPYNEFIIEQLAGDELADESLRRRLSAQEFHQARLKGDYNDEESEWLVATGFLRMGPWDPAMVMNDEARQLYIDDVINAVGQTFLSTTLRCFKCHDHKFDPLPTRDYYRMYAALAATQLAERPAPFLSAENLDGFEEGREVVQRLLAFATQRKNELEDKKETAAREWFEAHGLAYVSEQDRKELPDEKKPPRHIGLDDMEEGRLKVREQDEWIWTRRLERYEPMVQSVYNGPDPKFINARKLRMAGRAPAEWKPVSHILLGGALQAPGDLVSPGVLSAVGIPASLTTNDPHVISDDVSGRRLALAKWIAHPRHPLTTRSIVNRVWQYHFGKPLAGNPNHFGAKGDKPTHPELLDWLAADFVDNGWTLKRLHRLIMTSAAYQRSATHPRVDQLRNRDPNNDLLAYFPTRRLTAEELRDSILKITGELNPAIGGVPIMPEMNMEVALQPRMIQFSIAPAYQPSRTPRERNRRSIYAYRVRGQADPFLEVFNQPNPNESCDLRDTASVSPQAFTLLNSDVMIDRSIAFALRLQNEASSIDEQVRRACALALGRSPSNAEHRRMTDYVREMAEYHRGVQPEPVTYPTSVMRSLVEEFSGQPFEYDEILPVFENYTADKKPADVGADTRALADLCLLLLNSNEFAYVY